jgi:uncharacterized membrane protein
MNWNQLYGIKSYFRSSLWIVPFVAIPFELVVTRLVHWFDGWLGWSFLDLEVSGAQAVLQATITATLSFVVFTFGSLLVAIQVASAQLTPRIIATTLLRNDVVKYTVGLFIFTLLFALSAQNRIDKEVYQFVIFVTAILGLCCFAAFLFLIDYASRLLRPVSILSHVGDDGLAVIKTVYSIRTGSDPPIVESQHLGAPDRVILHQGTGIVLAVNLNEVMKEAERSNSVIELVPQVGDFVAENEPLFRIYGSNLINEEVLHSAVAYGSERTMEHDPTFAFRIIVDIAIRALSPAINDPTTAVLAMDQLHRMLRAVGMRDLRADETSDKSGKLRVLLRSPNWEDFVHLAFSEIRSYGSNNLQIVRRLRAMIENLLQLLPAVCHPALDQELSLLEREIEKNFTYLEELTLARVADSQGLGGHCAKRFAPPA